VVLHSRFISALLFLDCDAKVRQDFYTGKETGAAGQNLKTQLSDLKEISLMAFCDHLDGSRLGALLQSEEVHTMLEGTGHGLCIGGTGCGEEITEGGNMVTLQ